MPPLTAGWVHLWRGRQSVYWAHVYCLLDHRWLRQSIQHVHETVDSACTHFTHCCSGLEAACSQCIYMYIATCTCTLVCNTCMQSCNVYSYHAAVCSQCIQLPQCRVLPGIEWCLSKDQRHFEVLLHSLYHIKGKGAAPLSHYLKRTLLVLSSLYLMYSATYTLVWSSMQTATCTCTLAWKQHAFTANAATNMYNSHIPDLQANKPVRALVEQVWREGYTERHRLPNSLTPLQLGIWYMVQVYVHICAHTCTGWNHIKLHTYKTLSYTLYFPPCPVYQYHTSNKHHTNTCTYTYIHTYVHELIPPCTQTDIYVVQQQFQCIYIVDVIEDICITSVSATRKTQIVVNLESGPCSGN